MIRRMSVGFFLGFLCVASTHGANAAPMHPAHRMLHHKPMHYRKVVNINYRQQAEHKGYKRLSSFSNFPAFFPGLGVLYAKPADIPVGPYLAFDRNDALMATVYMVSVKDMNDKKSFDLAQFIRPGDHGDMYFNPGHPLVDTPHYHVVIWHVPDAAEARVAK